MHDGQQTMTASGAKNETHEHVNKNFNFQAIVTKHPIFYLNLMHGLHTKIH